MNYNKMNKQIQNLNNFFDKAVNKLDDIKYNENKYSFLEENEFYYDKQLSEKTIVYKFKMNEYRAIISIPNNENGFAWAKYFIKGDKESYDNGLEFPEWLDELFQKTSDMVEKQYRLKKLFKK